MLSYQTQLYIYFPSDGNNLMEIYMYFILWKLFMVSYVGYKKQFSYVGRSWAGSGSRHLSDEWGSFQHTVGRDVVS